MEQNDQSRNGQAGMGNQGTRGNQDNAESFGGGMPDPGKQGGMGSEEDTGRPTESGAMGSDKDRGTSEGNVGE